jgi:predicted anti-sigma-YlaC factor YlaD
MVGCKTIIANLSGYLDEEVSPETRRKIERHLRMCHRCSAVYNSTRKMLVIVGDEQVFEIPVGYEERLHAFLANHI